MSETKHTPLPWRRSIAPYRKKIDGEGVIAHEIEADATAAWIALVQEYPNIGQDGRANAELIVRAVNSHAALVDALSDLVRLTDHICKTTGYNAKLDMHREALRAAGATE